MSSDSTFVNVQMEPQPGIIVNNDHPISLHERQSSVISFEKSESPATYQARIEESISSSFPSFAHAELLALPYDRESKKDGDFVDRKL